MKQIRSGLEMNFLLRLLCANSLFMTFQKEGDNKDQDHQDGKVNQEKPNELDSTSMALSMGGMAGSSTEISRALVNTAVKRIARNRWLFSLIITKDYIV